MVWAVIGVGAASIIAGGVESYEAGKTSSAQLSLEQGTAGEQQYYNNLLMNLINNPSSVTSTPGYAFTMEQGTQAVQRAAAGGGFLNSGNEGVALEQYGQGLATSSLTQQESLLASLSGVQAASSPSSYGNAAVGGQASSAYQMNNLLTQLGIATGRFGSSVGGSDPGAAAANAGNAAASTPGWS